MFPIRHDSNWHVQLQRLVRCLVFSSKHQGPVVQSIVILTTSLRRQLSKFMRTTLSNTLLVFVEKNVRILHSHVFFFNKI